MPDLSENDQQEIRALLARRKRGLIGAAIAVAISFVVLLAAGVPLVWLAGYAAIYALWAVVMVLRYRQIVASCIANGYRP